MKKIENLFGTNKPNIAMVHFPPLIGYKNFPGIEYITKKMLDEIEIIEDSGFDGIILENNYDIPHTEFVEPEVTSMLTVLAKIATEKTQLPIGMSVLWNDYKTALSICASTTTKFIRVPSFVDTVKTNYGIMEARAEEVVEFRKKIGVEDCLIFADIQVKHSEMVDKTKSLDDSAQEAIDSGADALIITGKWTGDSPNLEELQYLRSKIKNFPIFIGSGANCNNVNKLLQFSDGVIVGNSIKEGEEDRKEVNLKPFEFSINPKRAAEFIGATRKL